MKNKICNLFIIAIIIAIIVIVVLIGIRYGGNYLNEKAVSASLIEIEETLQNAENDEGEVPTIEFKGYNIEGILEIPKINLKYPIIDHTNDETMKVSITKFAGPRAKRNRELYGCRTQQ